MKLINSLKDWKLHIKQIFKTGKNTFILFGIMNLHKTKSPVMLDAAPLTVFDAAANKTYFYQTDANKNVTDLKIRR